MTSGKLYDLCEVEFLHLYNGDKMSVTDTMQIKGNLKKNVLNAQCSKYLLVIEFQSLFLICLKYLIF